MAQNVVPSITLLGSSQVTVAQGVAYQMYVSCVGGWMEDRCH